MVNQQLSQAVALAYARVHLVICEASLQALKAVTTDPSTSNVIAVHEEACVDAYWKLQCAEASAEPDFEYGTKAEWNALSASDQSDTWAQFHSLCEQGTADQMYFYPVLMDMHMVGYVGH